MSKAISRPERRTYFNNPLIEESLRHLPAIIAHPSSTEFRDYLVDALHHSSRATRKRYAEYLAQRFSQNGWMNLALGRALGRYRDSRVGREILYFELLRAVPVLQDIALGWLAEIPTEGVGRKHLLAFLAPRLGERSARTVSQAALQTFRRCRKLESPRLAFYVPVWSEPPLDAFLYVLARLQPEPAMLRVDAFTAQSIFRAMLWPAAAIPGLLEAARLAGYVSKISELDQYHQFTLSDSGEARLDRLLAQPEPAAWEKPDSNLPAGGEPLGPPRRRRGAPRYGAEKRKTRSPQTVLDIELQPPLGRPERR